MMATSEAWTAARAGDWARWPGLPVSASPAAVVEALVGTALPLSVETKLGRRRVERYDAPNLRVWANGGVAILVEWIDPPCAGTVVNLLAALGAPDREGPGRHLRFGATTTEYVFASRGLALTMAASYSRPESFVPYLASVQLFAAGSLRDFVVDLGGNDQPGPRQIGLARR